MRILTSGCALLRMTLCFYVTLNGVKSLFRFFAALRMTGEKALRMTTRGPRRSPAKRVRWGKGRRREYSAVFAEAETERYELLLTLSLRANAVSVAIRNTLGVKRNGFRLAKSRPMGGCSLEGACGRTCHRRQAAFAMTKKKTQGLHPAFFS